MTQIAVLIRGVDMDQKDTHPGMISHDATPKILDSGVCTLSREHGEEPGTLGKGEFSLVPLTLSEVLRRTIMICQRHLGKLVGLAIPSWLFTAVLAAAWWRAWKDFLSDAHDNVGIVGVLGLFVLAGWLIMTVFLFGQGVVAHAVLSIYAGKDIRFWKAHGFSFRKLSKLLPTTFTVTFLPILALWAYPLVLLVPFLLFSLDLKDIPIWCTRLFFTTLFLYYVIKTCVFDKATFFEDKDSMAAIKRSWRLLDGMWFKANCVRAAAVLAVTMVIPVGIHLLQNGIWKSMFAWLPALRTSFVAAWQLELTVFVSLIGTLFGFVALVVFYFDVRVRREGPDWAGVPDLGAS